VFASLQNPRFTFYTSHILVPIFKYESNPDESFLEFGSPKYLILSKIKVKEISLFKQ